MSTRFSRAAGEQAEESLRGSLMPQPTSGTRRTYPELTVVGIAEFGAEKRCGSCSCRGSVPNRGRADAECQLSIAKRSFRGDMRMKLPVAQGLVNGCSVTRPCENSAAACAPGSA